MSTTLAPHADGLVLIIEQSILDALHIKVDTPLEVTVRDSQLIIVPVQTDPAFGTALQQVNDQYHSALQRLAE
jgi:hypothetical protein